MSEASVEGHPYGSDQQIHEDAMYNQLMYMNIPGLDVIEGDFVAMILSAAKDAIENRPEDMSDADYQMLVDEYPAACEMVEYAQENYGYDPDNVVIDNFSWESGVQDNPNYLQGAVFRTNDTPPDVTITFRGTPDGGWVDNGKGLIFAYPGSGGDYYYTDANGVEWGPMSSADYDAMRYTEQVLEEYPDSTVCATGHSKGAHHAMLAGMMFSQVTGVVALDAEGVSPEFYANMENSLTPEEIEALRGKIVAVNGRQDFVNVLGVPLALPQYTIYLEIGSRLEKPISWHSLRGLIDSDGSMMPAAAGRGPIGNGVRALWEVVEKLPPEQRNAIITIVMVVCQATLGRGVEPEGGWARAIVEALVSVGVLNPDSVSLLIVLAAGTALVMGFVALWNKLFPAGANAGEYTMVNTVVKLNTETARGDAQTLQGILEAIDGIAQEMESLRMQGEWVYLYNIPGNTSMVGVQETIRKTKNYMNSAAEKFEKVESKVLKAIPSTAQSVPIVAL